MRTLKGLRVASAFFCRRATRTDGACVDATGIIPGHHLRIPGATLDVDAVLQLACQQPGSVSIEVRVVLDGATAASHKLHADCRPPASVGIELHGLVVPANVKRLRIDVRERRGEWREAAVLVIDDRAGRPVPDPFLA